MAATELYRVWLYDGFDREWISVSPPLPYEDAMRMWNEKTDGGRHRTRYEDIDYYIVKPAEE